MKQNVSEGMFIDSFKQNEERKNNFSYDGKKGDVLIFPSAFKHEVERHNSKKTRISFSFNLEIKGVIKE